MKAIILAAGLGTRLRPITNNTPKPLVLINGRPQLEYVLWNLGEYGIKDILINTHYLSGQVEDFIINFLKKRTDFHIQTYYESQLLGTAGTVSVNKDFFSGEDFFVVYADNLVRFDFKGFYSYHKIKDGIVTMACNRPKNITQKGMVIFNENKKIEKFVEKPLESQAVSPWANAGIYCCKNSILDILNKYCDTELDFGKDVFPDLLSAKESLYAYEMKEELLDIGSLEEYERAQTAVKELFKDFK